MLGLGNGKRLTTEDLNAINIPVLIGIGDLDNMVSIEESAQAANALPSGSLSIMEGFYHPIEKNDMAIVSEKIKALLQG